MSHRHCVLLLLCVPLLALTVARSQSGTDPLPALVEVLNETGDTQAQLDILRGLSAAFKGQRQVPMPKGWERVETKLERNANADVRALAQSLSLTFGSMKALAALRKTLVDPSADSTARRTALDSLLGAKDAGLPDLLFGLLKDRDLRGAAIRGLAAYNDPNTPAALLDVFNSFDSAEQRDALNTLSSRAAFANPMLTALGDGKVPRNALTAEIVRQLHNLKNAETDRQLEKVYGTVRESSADKKKEIERYKRIFRAGGSQQGDASRGRAVFVRTCQQCHSLFDTGGKVGPDLTGSNRGDLDYILQNIVDPNAVIPNEYRASTIEMKDGRSITCIVKQHDDRSVTAVTQNETLVLPRNEIQAVQQSELSMMPEGLLAPLQDQEVRDLLYYLSRPGQVPLPPENAAR
jgi:putative heme-binding domain-containing protein